MQTDYLRYLVDIYETNSIAAAARKSFISPQGARKAIGVLENEFGCELVVRSGRATKLTDQGHAILKSAKDMLALEEGMRSIIDKINSSDKNAPTVDAIVYQAGAFDTSIFKPFMMGSRKDLRNIRFVSCNNSLVVQNLAANHEDLPEIRIGILTLFSPLSEENALVVSQLAAHGYSVIPWFETYDELAVSSRSPLAKKASVSYSDIKSQSFVASNTDILSVIQKLFGPDANCMLIGDSGFEYSLVSNNEAVCFAPALNRLYHEDESYVHIPVKNAYRVTIAFAVHSNAESMKYVNLLRGCINDFYQSLAEDCSQYISIFF